MRPADRAWAEVKDAVADALELPSESRPGFLDSRCPDPHLRAEVERLLEACDRAAASAVLDTPAARFAAPVLAHMEEQAGVVADGDPLQLVGRTVSHFRIIEPVARGGMGVVYRAEDTRLGRPVALKVPLAARYVDRAAMDRFRQEARAAAALDHPNLCPVYETGETSEGDLFYTMPLYEGETLKARLGRETRLPLAHALDVATQLCHGLGAAHQAGIVHRDLKPANVMLLPDGAVKILDFGLAKASDLTLTGSWARLGTIAYMAPEQVHGHKVDRRADLWALGVVLYEMVTGSRPFGGGHEIGVAHAILHDQPRRASALRDDLPAELDDVIHACLRKDPAERFQTAEELATAFGGIRPDQGPWYRRKLRRARLIVARQPRRRTLAIAATLGLVAAAGARLAERGTTVTPPPVSLAVLPFERVGDSAATDYLAVGLSDGIGTALARLRGIIVPGYLTASVYREHPGALKQIGAEQQVRSVLRGSVQRVDDRVRVDAELLGTEDGKRLWAQRYERPAGEMQEIQRDIVRATLATLRIRPTRDEQAVLDRPATTDARAYDAYLQGRAVELAGGSRELWRPVPTDNIRRAMSLYSRARELDPGFAAARARLALMHTLAAATYDSSEGRREQARVEAEIARRLRPELPEAHEALAAYWDLKGEASKGIDELRLALDAVPNRADLRLSLGEMLSHAGHADEAAAELARAMHLEPGNAKAAVAAATTYSWLRRREDAMRAFDRAITLAPDWHAVKVIKGHAYLRWTGIPDTLAALIERVPPTFDPNGMVTFSRYTVLSVQRRYADGVAMLDRSGSELSRDAYIYQPTPLMRALLYDAMGNRKLARANYERARSVIQDSVDAHPTNPHMRMALGFAYAGLGRNTDAVREARRAMELAPIEKGSDVAQVVMGKAVEVFAKVGAIDQALELLELLFSMPAGREVTVPLLRVWPGFDPLRGDPRFEELLTRFAAVR